MKTTTNLAKCLVFTVVEFAGKTNRGDACLPYLVATVDYIKTATART